MLNVESDLKKNKQIHTPYMRCFFPSKRTVKLILDYHIETCRSTAQWSSTWAYMVFKYTFWVKKPKSTSLTTVSYCAHAWLYLESQSLKCLSRFPHFFWSVGLMFAHITHKILEAPGTIEREEIHLRHLHEYWLLSNSVLSLYRVKQTN